MPCVEKLMVSHMDVTSVNPIDGPCLSLMVPVLPFTLPRAQGAPPGVQAPRVARRGQHVRPRHRRPRAHPLRPRPPPRPRRLRQGLQPQDAAVRRERAHGASQGHGVGVPLPAVREHGELDRLQRDIVAEKSEVRAAAEQGLSAGAHRAGGLAGDEDGPHGGGGAGRGGAAARGGGGAARGRGGGAGPRAAEEAARLLAKQFARDKQQ